MNMVETASSLAARVADVRARIAAACGRAARDPATVTLIAVTKTQPANVVLAALQAGLTDFGENRVQEALPKVAAVRATVAAAGGTAPTFHLVGHLQTNKARALGGAFAILHAADSERVLHAVDAASAGAGRPQRVMIEVNVSAEPTKFGIAPAVLTQLLAAARGLPHIRVEGLMTVAPRADDPEALRPIFRSLRRLAQDHGLAALSMGMTDDFEVAIEEGATHVRIGRAIFLERPQ